MAEVMDEAILLRDDGLELCARAAQRREESGPPWAILAIWWFWVGAPRKARELEDACDACISC